jgi:hypothetical protein
LESRERADLEMYLTGHLLGHFMPCPFSLPDTFLHFRVMNNPTHPLSEEEDVSLSLKS